MVNSNLELLRTNHPSKDAKKAFEALVGIDEQKNDLLNTLYLLFAKDQIEAWKKNFHPKGISFLDQINSGLPLIILEGEVGCGKTALANSIGTPLAEKLGKDVLCMETPSNIRGSGRVGEISARITAAFMDAKSNTKKNEVRILVIDEADDLATSRAQNQAHHEDRAGLNVLIKQIDLLVRDSVNIVVILITNRLAVLDPAVRRRAALELTFERPNPEKLRIVFEFILQGTKYTNSELQKLIDFAKSKKTPYSYSDLIQKIGKQAIYKAILTNKAFDLSGYFEILRSTEPSPMIKVQNEI